MKIAAERSQAALLPDGRLHLHDGPIDLVIAADGDTHAAFRAAAARFATVLDELCAELPHLRAPTRPGAPPAGAVARRMWDATLPHHAGFITPMAAVAGAVAEAVLAAMLPHGLTRACVNNGGDIALHLAAGQAYVVGAVDRPDRPALAATLRIAAADGIRGIATSGWRGRSFSLGIADAVTVLAPHAADADAAATVIANAVDLPGHPAIGRTPARALQPDSDLGDRLVTTSVGPLAPREAALALDRGAAIAGALLAAGHIRAAMLRLAGHTRTIGKDRPWISANS